MGYRLPLITHRRFALFLTCCLSLMMVSAGRLPGTSALSETPGLPLSAMISAQNDILYTGQQKVDLPNCTPVRIRYNPHNALPFVTVPIPMKRKTETPSLRLLAENRDFWIGTSVAASLLNNRAYASLLVREFNMLVPEVDMKWDGIHPEADRYDFSKGDTIVAFAEAHRMAVHGHVLVWDLQLPSYILEAQYTRQEWINTLCVHVKTVVTHYRGRILVWDVVNEALDDKGMLRDTIWLRNIGPEYIAMAFQWAHEADPMALLVYNDFQAEGMNQKSQAVFTLVQGLINLGIPIHAVGLQMHVHIDGPPTYQGLQQNMQRLSALGLQVYITEMDVRLQYSDRNNREKLSEQAQVYRRAFSACLSNPACKMFELWGLTDLYSWIPDYTGKEDAPLLFDRAGKAKPAYEAILKLLQTP